MAAFGIKNHKVVAPAGFDVAQFVADYEGHGKIVRLLFIATVCPELESPAFSCAIEELKRTNNTLLYKEVAEKSFPKSGTPLDQAWVDAADKKALEAQERLELDINAFLSQMDKENARLSFTALGDHHYARGELHSALKNYVRTRDYCSNSAHSLDTCLNVIKVSLELGNWSHVMSYVSKAEQLADPKSKPLIAAQLKICSGLAQLSTQKYKLAARKFIDVGPELGNSYASVVSARDIGVIAGLTALATFDRAELRRRVLDNPQLAAYLELTPGLGDLLKDFYASRYAPCLGHLATLRPLVELDFHLWNHVRPLYELIRSRALVQYFSPYSSARLDQMADAFKTDVAGLTQELSKLIMDGHIAARIDSHNGILYARSTDLRSNVYEKMMVTGTEYQRNVNALMLRMNLLRHDFMVRPTRIDWDDDKNNKKHSKDSAAAAEAM